LIAVSTQQSDLETGEAMKRKSWDKAPFKTLKRSKWSTPGDAERLVSSMGSEKSRWCQLRLQLWPREDTNMDETLVPEGPALK